MNASTRVEKHWNSCIVPRDDAWADSGNLPAPEIIAQEIVDDLEAALDQFHQILADMTAMVTQWKDTTC